MDTNNSFPYIFKENIKELRERERPISEYAVETFNNTYNPAAGYNVRLEETPDLIKLWGIFDSILSSRFENLEVLPNDRYKSCWTYVQNNERYESKWHSHIKTASINAVYYPSIPDTTGTLSILTLSGDEAEVELNQGDLVVFPGWLIHKPNPQKHSRLPRVSINLELLTSTRPVFLCNNEKVLW